MKIFSLYCLMILSTLCSAEELSPSAKEEIEHLVSHLDGSGCQFNRNGSWYSASEASAHIRKKYEYLLNKKMLGTTESFIEKAATESSMSGKPYQVKCAGQPVLLSSVWFSRELLEYRKTNVR